MNYKNKFHLKIQGGLKDEKYFYKSSFEIRHDETYFYNSSSENRNDETYFYNSSFETRNDETYFYNSSFFCFPRVVLYGVIRLVRFGYATHPGGPSPPFTYAPPTRSPPRPSHPPPTKKQVGYVFFQFFTK